MKSNMWNFKGLIEEEINLWCSILVCCRYNDTLVIKKQEICIMNLWNNEIFYERIWTSWERFKSNTYSRHKREGSCTEMMTNILINAGYKVGKFISPHLIKYNERISIQNQNITNEKMEEIIEKIQPKIENKGRKTSTK